jgi:MoaA/NifB/PqqE/SkfB family radical SAM enzyme
MKVGLIQAPVWWTVDAPLGLAQVAGCLRAAGHEVKVLDLNILLWSRAGESEKVLWNWENFHRWNDQAFVKDFFSRHADFIEAEVSRLLSEGVKVAGFSVCSGAHLPSLELAGRLKAAAPDLKVFMGGQFFFDMGRALEWARKPELDAVFTGAADFAVQAATAAVESGAFPKAIAGVICRDGDKVIDGGPGEPIKNLDSVPFSDYSAFPMELYSNQLHLPFMSARGCVWKCRFCSSCNVWPGFAQMSGNRIYAEIMHHKALLPGKYHVEFYDLLGNGNMASLARFTDLILEDQKVNAGKNFFGWKINAIIRPEMTPDLLARMRKANCKDIIYGLESGSARVLALMGKRYDRGTALRVLEGSKRAGIHTAVNFMFGFPGEKEEDFQETLALLRDAAPFLDRVYASATFTSLEEGSYLTANPGEFGIRKVRVDMFHNLYWETEDGANDYLVRLERYNRFRAEAVALGLDAYKGVQGNLEQERLSALAQFRRYRGNHLEAVKLLLEALDLNPGNDALSGELAPYYADLRKLLLAAVYLHKAARRPGEKARFEAAAARMLESMRDRGEIKPGGELAWMRDAVPELLRLRHLAARAHRLLEAAGDFERLPAPPPLPAEARGAPHKRALAAANTAASKLESHEGRSVLSASPRKVFLQVDGPCNADCLFCSRNEQYAFFDFDAYRRTLHPRLFRLLRQAEELLFTGSGELLLLPEAPKILAYFNKEYPQAAKHLATNASHRNRRLWELFCDPADRYTLQISLHAGTPETHRRMTGLDDFGGVLENLEFLAAARAKTGWPKLHLMFVMTTENIADMPAYAALGAKIKADKLVANHAYIYRPDQARLALQTMKAETNSALAAASKTAAAAGLDFSFPPPFSDAPPAPAVRGDCREAWSQVMINPAGDLLPCDIYGEFRHNISAEGFWQIWNGPAYREARRAITRGEGCYARCPRHNPASLATDVSLKIERARPGAGEAAP